MHANILFCVASRRVSVKFEVTVKGRSAASPRLRTSRDSNEDCVQPRQMQRELRGGRQALDRRCIAQLLEAFTDEIEKRTCSRQAPTRRKKAAYRTSQKRGAPW